MQSEKPPYFLLTKEYALLLYAIDLFLYPLKISEKKCFFLMFSGGIERYQWYDMD